jgi:hypothetical protein
MLHTKRAGGVWKSPYCPWLCISLVNAKLGSAHGFAGVLGARLGRRRRGHSRLKCTWIMVGPEFSSLPSSLTGDAYLSSKIWPNFWSTVWILPFLMPPCLFCVGSHCWNMQGRVSVSAPRVARHVRRPARRGRRGDDARGGVHHRP